MLFFNAHFNFLRWRTHAKFRGNISPQTQSAFDHMLLNHFVVEDSVRFFERHSIAFHKREILNRPAVRTPNIA